MAILLIGGTGHIGSLVAQELAHRGAAAATLGHTSSGDVAPSGPTLANGAE
jgi:uncharacterized protein YbjT (DUF2867 family)